MSTTVTEAREAFIATYANENGIPIKKVSAISSTGTEIVIVGTDHDQVDRIAALLNDHAEL
jgi:ribosomal protein L6P/L9E